jgi:hypothetical protein
MGRYVCTTLLVLATFLLAMRGFAQTFTGTVVGRVVDAQQLAVAAALVKLHNVQKDFERRTITNARGEYRFELIPPKPTASRQRIQVLLPPRSMSKLWLRRRCGPT